MYEEFYKLHAEPFRLSPDHRFCYDHKGYAKARAYMAYAFMRAEGFVMITGRPGTGKTTLIGELIENLADDNVTTANLVCTQLQADDLLKMVAYSFGVEHGVVEKGELLQHLKELLYKWHRDGRRALLIVDEAQDLAASAMEELRLLTNIQSGGKPLLQIFLLGQPELRDLILSPALEQVHQRIVAASHLEPLKEGETEAYIKHRLEKVGWNGDPAFSKAVFPLVYKFSEGIPRRINLICSRLFLHGGVERRHTLGVQDLREVIQELQSENLAAGQALSNEDFAVQDEFDEISSPQINDNAREQPDNSEAEQGDAAGANGQSKATTALYAVGNNGPLSDIPALAISEKKEQLADVVVAPAFTAPDSSSAPPRPAHSEVSMRAAAAPATPLKQGGENIREPSQTRRRTTDGRKKSGRDPNRGLLPLLVIFTLALIIVLGFVFAPSDILPDRWRERVEGFWRSVSGGGEAPETSSLGISQKLRQVGAIQEAQTRRDEKPTEGDLSDTGGVHSSGIMVGAGAMIDRGFGLDVAEPDFQQEVSTPAGEKLNVSQGVAPMPGMEPNSPQEFAPRAGEGFSIPQEDALLPGEELGRQQEVALEPEGELPPEGESTESSVAAGELMPPELPESEPAAPEQRLVLVEFAFDSAELSAEAKIRLDEVAASLAEKPQKIYISGYSDSRGEPSYNLLLSRRRAASVAAYLADGGIRPERLIVEGRGTYDEETALSMQRERVANIASQRFVQIVFDREVLM